MRGSDIDYPAKPPGFHVWPYRFCQVKCRCKVNADDLIPFVLWKIFNGRHVLNAGIVHENVNTTKRMHTLVNKRTQGRGLQHVRG